MDNRTSPFSDKLISYLLDRLNLMVSPVMDIVRAVSIRKDLKTTYAKIIADVYQYEENIKTYMIKNEWLEKPPVALNRDKLVQD